MFLQYLAATEDFPLFAGREAKIQFIELHANPDRSSILNMCRPMEGYPADKDLKTQYEWAKAWTKKRFRELGWDTDSHSDTDNDEDSQGTGEDNRDSGGEGRSGVEDWDDDVPIFACLASRTPPTAKKPEASGDSLSGGEPLRKRHHQRIAEIDKVIDRVRAGAQAVQLIRPDERCGDLDRNLEELINVCIEHPHVRCMELQVSEIQHSLHAEIETDFFAATGRELR